MKESEKTALSLVLYSMVYIQGDLYSTELFSDDFCKGFREKFADKFHEDIRTSLEWVLQHGDYAVEEVLPMLKEKYSKEDIYYYLKEFHSRLSNCN